MYDPKCYNLAMHFLEDHPDFNDEEHRSDLAQNIQDEIEAWISAEEASLEIAERQKK